MRACLVLFFVAIWASSGAAQQLVDATGDGPKNWQEDLRWMLEQSRAEPTRPETWAKVRQFKRRGSIRKVTKDHRYALFSFAGGIIGFRVGGDPSAPGGGDVLIGIHASAEEPPPLPFALAPSVGGIALMARKSQNVAREPLYTESERYFGEKCTAYVYGSGHWITRYFVRHDRVIAISIALEP